MKRLTYVGLTILVMGAIAFVIYQYRGELGLTESAGNPATSNADNAARPSVTISWQTVDRTPDGFKVDMPAGASEIQVPAYTRAGGQEMVEMLQASAGSDSTYAVAWADNPPVERASGDGAEKTLDMARDGALARIEATLTNESRSNRTGYPERDFSGSNAGGGILNARLILTGTRLYMLIATFPAAGSRRDDDVAHFFDSFNLTSARNN